MDKTPFSAYDFLGYLGSGFLILAAFDYIQSKPAILREDVGFFPGAFWILLAYIIGHLVASLSAFLYERWIVGAWLGRPNVNLLHDRRTGWRRILLGGYLSPLPPGAIGRIREKASLRGVDTLGEELFVLVFSEAKCHPDLIARMQTFLNLYGFCRNISLAALIAGSIVLIGRAPSFGREEIAWAVAALVVGVGMFYRYLKFFRQYSYEMFVTWPALSVAGEN